MIRNKICMMTELSEHYTDARRRWNTQMRSPLSTCHWDKLSSESGLMRVDIGQLCTECTLYWTKNWSTTPLGTNRKHCGGLLLVRTLQGDKSECAESVRG